MDKVAILIHYEGRWNDTGRYVDYKMEGVVYDSTGDFEGLVDAIASQIGVDTSNFEMVLMYKVSDGSPPMRIHNNMGVQVYLALKGCNTDFFSKYPLCITCRQKSMGAILYARSVESPRECFVGENSNFYPDVGVMITDECEDSQIINNNQNHVVAANCKKTVVEVMRRYALLRGFQITTTRSTKNRYNLRCATKNCTWLFKSSSLGQSGIFKVRKYCGEHTCPSNNRQISRRRCNSGVLGTLLLDKCSDRKTKYTPGEIKRDMKKEHGITLTYMQAWRGRQKAFNILLGDPAISYAKLPIYLYMLEKTYPGTVVDLKKTEGGHFLYTFVALDACIRGWEYCRPIVVVDGTHLRTAFEGTMLIASTLDPGGHIMPLAYGVVDSENDNSWNWFFQCFKTAYGDREDMCFVSDRNKSIWNATASVYPGIPHCACIYHLWTNVLKRAKKKIEEVRRLFFGLAKAYTIKEFDELMLQLKDSSARCHAYLVKTDFGQWSRAHSGVKRTWTLTSNIAESINNVILPGRRLPIIPMLEYMRKTIQIWNERNQEEAKDTITVLTRRYNKIMHENKKISHRMMVRASTEHLHTVIDGAKRFKVCLNTRMCSCGRFQHDEIPCCHAIAAIEYRNSYVGDYCSIYYSRKNFQDAYAIPIEPLPCESTWIVPEYVSEEIVLPPTVRRRPGRLSNYDRKRGVTELKLKRSKVSCSICASTGHNMKTCPQEKKCGVLV